MNEKNARGLKGSFRHGKKAKEGADAPVLLPSASRHVMTSRIVRRSTVAFALALALVFPRTSFADEEEGERLFREGRELMLEGRFDEACPKIAESQRIDPHVGTLLNLAACHERQGRFASAWVEYQQALTTARAEGQADREHLAEERIAVVAPRVPWVTIRASSPPPPGVEITLDGAVVAPAALGKEMPVDAGDHVVRATSHEGAPFEERFVLAEAEHRTVSLPGPVVVRGSEPSTIVVDPHPKGGPVEPAKEGRTGQAGWVFEPGLFAGFVSAQRRVEIYDSASSRYVDSDETASRAAFGVDVFGGYRTRQRVYLGARLVAGAPVGGSSVVAFGPSVSVEATSLLRIGAWVLLGNADLNTAEGGGLGAGVELGLRVATLSNAEIFVQTTPFFVAGSGSAIAVPVGISCLF